jgi:hypothetical protein
MSPLEISALEERSENLVSGLAFVKLKTPNLHISDSTVRIKKLLFMTAGLEELPAASCPP